MGLFIESWEEDMHLTRDEREMLDGKHGYPVQKSMELLVGLGECYGAERMIPVASAHVIPNVSPLGKGGACLSRTWLTRELDS
jgi:predicted aconitase